MLFSFVKNNISTIFIINLFTILVVIILILLTFIWLLTTFYCYKFVKNTLKTSTTNYLDFDKNSKDILNTYKDYNVDRIYVYKEPLSKFNNYLVSIFKRLNHIKEDISDLCHCYIIFEVKKDGYKKLIKIDKLQKTAITDELIIIKNSEFISFELKQQIKFKNLINKTIKSYGKKNFFNWDANKSNCVDIINEFFKTTKIKHDISFIKRMNKIKNKFILNDYYLYIWKFVIFIHSLKYKISFI